MKAFSIFNPKKSYETHSNTCRPRIYFSITGRSGKPIKFMNIKYGIEYIIEKLAFINV